MTNTDPVKALRTPPKKDDALTFIIPNLGRNAMQIMEAIETRKEVTDDDDERK